MTPAQVKDRAAEALKTKAAQVKAQFEAAGTPVSEWADANGFPRPDVYRVLNGYSPCKRGLPHRIAVALGIKAKTTSSHVAG